MTRIKKLKKWRRINPYICSKCGKKRYSFIFEKAKEMVCTVCSRNTVPDNQPSLFEPVDPEKFGTKLNYVK